MTTSIATRLITAFATYADLTMACQKGYIPTLTVSKSDSSHERKAKIILNTALTASGFRVFGA